MIQHTQARAATAIAPTREIEIPTATAIVCLKDDPYTVLIGESSKHEFPVLPGGKIDRVDVTTSSIEDAALNCIRRELPEEIGASPAYLKFLFRHNDQSRDVRVVPVKMLRDTIVGDSLRGCLDDELVTGRYGTPDFVFVGSVEQDQVSRSDELSGLVWVNLRTGVLPRLSAGHEKVLARYLEYLSSHSTS